MPVLFPSGRREIRSVPQMKLGWTSFLMSSGQCFKVQGHISIVVCSHVRLCCMDFCFVFKIVTAGVVCVGGASLCYHAC